MKIWVQKWEESEAGWGQRPDGYSLHLHQEDIRKYLNVVRTEEFKRGYGAENIPHEYSRPSGDPYLTEVTDEVLKGQIIQSESGIRLHGGSYPVPLSPGADQTGWVPVTNEPKTPSTKSEEEKTKDQLRETIEKGEQAKIDLAALDTPDPEFVFDSNTHCWTVEENGWLGVINKVPDVDGGGVFFSWACMADISHTTRWTRTETLHYAKEACLEALRKAPKGPRPWPSVSPSRYPDDIPAYGDLFTVEVFREEVSCGMFIDDDGSGCPSNGVKCDMGFNIFPSNLGKIPEDATHIIWFNK